MKIYDLMWGNFDITELKDDTVPYLIAYYPFYLYRNGFFLIPDTLNKSPPFIKKQTYIQQFKNLQQTTCYLLNHFCIGYATKQNNPHSDSPFDARTFSFSFDLVTPFAYLPNYNQTIELFHIDIKSDGGTTLNSFYVRAHLDLSVSNGDMGSIQIDLDDATADIPHIFSVELKGFSNNKGIIEHRETQYHKNFYERMRNLRIVLSKQTIVFTVIFLDLKEFFIFCGLFNIFIIFKI